MPSPFPGMDPWLEDPARWPAVHTRLITTLGDALVAALKPRYEVVIEGTRDERLTPAARWQEYGFKGKPGELGRRPPQVAPYHLRLDWLMWFLPLGRSLEDWFTAFLARLLQADDATLRLLAADPFAGERPRWVRVVSYRYRFSTRAEFRETRARWVRDRRRMLVAPIALRR